jgi:hypothetical protein
MKLTKTILGSALVGTIALLSGITFQSCSDQPDKYEIASGKPSIYYVRLSKVSAKDSLITGAYMGTNITFVGENLRSITKMYFNDQEAILNSSFITDNTLLVDVPNTLTNNPTDKIYMVNNRNDTTTYDFKVLIPKPVVSSLSNEFAADGETVTLNGDYLLNYDTDPLQITMAGNVPVTDFISYSKSAVTFKVPAGSQKGYVYVTTKYGKTKSSFYFRDDRYMLFDWDGTHGNALASGHGWRNGVIGKSPVTPVDGNYLIFKGAMTGKIGATWDEDNFSFDYWPDPDNGYPELNTLFDASDLSKLELKFEVNVPVAWNAASLQIIFTGNSDVTYSKASNSYISSNTLPRALWTPWYGTKSGYTTTGWTTISIPLSEFKYDNGGKALTAGITSDQTTGLTFFVWKGGYVGTDCTPTICIDNIRIAPIE